MDDFYKLIENWVVRVGTHADAFLMIFPVHENTPNKPLFFVKQLDRDCKELLASW
jgi:hypothetical protein